METVRDLPVDLIDPGRYQPRQTFTPETLEALADSMANGGQVQPIIVRPHDVAGSTRYELVAGERRWRAALLKRYPTVKAIIRAMDDRAAAVLALTENTSREDLNPIEEAFALRRLVDDFGMSHEEIATTIGEPRVTVTHLLGLTKMNPAVQVLIREGSLTFSHAKVLVAVPMPLQLQLAKDVVKLGLNVRELEKRLKRAMQSPTKASSPATKDPDIARLEGGLGEFLHANVAIEQVGPRTRLTLEFVGDGVVEGFFDRIGFKPDA